MHVSLHVSHKKRSHVTRVYTSVFECIFPLKWSRQTGRWKLILPVMYTFELKKKKENIAKKKENFHEERLIWLHVDIHYLLFFALK